jgi:hypothetical protein
MKETMEECQGTYICGHATLACQVFVKLLEKGRLILKGRAFHFLSVYVGFLKVLKALFRRDHEHDLCFRRGLGYG